MEETNQDYINQKKKAERDLKELQRELEQKDSMIGKYSEKVQRLGELN